MNLLPYSAQIAGVAAVAALAAAAMRINAPDVRHLYWRGVLLLCLLLPALQGRAARLEPHAAPAAATAWTPVIDTSAVTSVAARAAAAAPIDWAFALAALLGAGVVVRLTWMLVGLARLGRLRRAGEPARADGIERELQAIVGTRADIRYVEGLTQPATFGMLRPVVLLPQSLRDRTPDVQRAVIGHELLHVQRRDWAWLVGEEIVRAAFWFHPGVAFVVSRIQLTREEVVDGLGVVLMDNRRAYAEALLAFADARPVQMTAAFARRRHLLRRIQLLAREGNMSSTRVAVSAVVMAVAVVAGTRYAVGAFPLQQAASPGPAQTVPATGPGAVERRAQPVTPENPIPRRIASADAIYPDAALAAGARGAVHLWATIDEFGRVSEARPTHVSVSTHGQPNEFSVSFNADNLKDQSGFTGQTTGNPGSEGSALARALVDASVAAVKTWQYDPPARGPISFAAVFTFQPPGNVKSAQLTTAPPPPPPPPPPTRDVRVIDGVTYTRVPSLGTPSTSNISDGALRIGGDIKPPTKLRHVPPAYPPIAQSARVQGIIIIEARIEADGRVSQARVLKSIPLLDQAAIDAVTQWEFTPTLVNGVASPVVMTVTVNFSLD